VTKARDSRSDAGYGVALADIDLDGDLDVGAALSGGLNVYFNKGHGSFDPGEQVVEGFGLRDIVAFDSTGMGPDDFVTCDTHSDLKWRRVRAANGKFALSPESYDTSTTAQSIALGDFDNNGLVDLAFFGNGPTVMLAGANGTFTNPVALPTTATFLGDVIHLDDDGNADLVTRSSSDELQLWYGEGAGVFSAGPTVPTAKGVAHIEIADFSGDGLDDIAVCGTDSNTIAVHVSDGLGGLASAKSAAAGVGPKGSVAADFDNDGDIDLVVARDDALDGGLTFMENDGTGSLTAVETVWTPDNPRGDVAYRDITGDGAPDIVAVGAHDGSLIVLRADP